MKQERIEIARESGEAGRWHLEFHAVVLVPASDQESWRGVYVTGGLWPAKTLEDAVIDAREWASDNGFKVGAIKIGDGDEVVLPLRRPA